MHARGSDSVMNGRLSGAIDRGLSCLAARQLPDGSFTTLAGMGEDLERTGTSDPSVFTTAMVATALRASADSRASRIVQRAIASLQSERLPIGAWRFWARVHPGASFMPPDVDDTACCARAMREAVPHPAFHEALMLGNRNADGLFYTWILPRFRHLPMPSAWPSLAWIMASPLKLRRWFLAGNRPQWTDVDLVVNINVVAALGERVETRAAARWALEVVKEAREAVSDRWYQSEMAAWFAILRCAEGGVTSLDAARPGIVQRLLAACNDPNLDRLRPVDLACAASLLCAWNPEAECLPAVVARILAAQRPDGSWPLDVLYYDGVPIERRWGSADATTALSVEALSRARAVGLAS